MKKQLIVRVFVGKREVTHTELQAHIQKKINERR